MKIFDDEKLDNLFLEQSENLRRALSPVIDQIVLVKMRRDILPRDMYKDGGRQREYYELMHYYVRLIHQLIGYNPSNEQGYNTPFKEGFPDISTRGELLTPPKAKE